MRSSRSRRPMLVFSFAGEPPGEPRGLAGGLEGVCAAIPGLYHRFTTRFTSKGDGQRLLTTMTRTIQLERVPFLASHCIASTLIESISQCSDGTTAKLGRLPPWM